MSFQIIPLTGSVGAAVQGIDLHKSLVDSDFETLKRAFLQHCVLVFRGQHLSEGTHLAFARRWGEPVVTPMLRYIEGYPALFRVVNPTKAHAETENWHYDATFTPAPPKISILSARVVPAGGDTMWSNQYIAYERLSDGMKQMLEGLQARFVGTRIGRYMGIDPKDIPSEYHPIVRTHPETGRKALYVGHWETATHLRDMTEKESRPLLDYLYEQSTTPDNIYRHLWHQGDVVMWDNRCTMHYAVHDYGSAERVLDRVTLKGDVPV